MHCVYTGCIGIYSVRDNGVRQWRVCGLYVECGVQLVCGFCICVQLQRIVGM